MVGSVIAGGLAGAVGTWLMDQVTTGIQQGQGAQDAERERAARPNGQSSVMNLVDLLSARLEVELDEQRRSQVAEVVHYGLGIVPGAAYALLRKRLPVLGAGRGLLFGLLLFLVNDELAGTALGVAGPPGAYPLSTHFRGLVGHLVLGVATDAGVEVLRG